MYACDPEAYTVFQPLFDAVIKMYHKVDKVEHPTPTFGDLDNLGFGDLDPDNNMIVSTRVRVGRSHDGFSFPPCSNKEVGLRHEFMRGEMSLKSTCDVNLLSKLSIIFKEWRVMNNVGRGGARV